MYPTLIARGKSFYETASADGRMCFPDRVRRRLRRSLARSGSVGEPLPCASPVPLLRARLSPVGIPETFLHDRRRANGVPALSFASG